MFCKSCGHEIDIDSIYCAFCGVKQSESLKPQQAAPPFVVQPTNKNIEFTAPPVQPLVTTPDLEIKTKNESVSSENFLDDIDNIHKSLHRPNTVNISVFLQVAIIVYHLVDLVLGMVANSIPGIQAAAILVFSLWFGSLANSIFFRRKRARITYCILISLGIALTVFFVLVGQHINSTLMVEQLLIVVVNFTAGILLFTKSATNWFNADSENIFSVDQKSTSQSP